VSPHVSVKVDERIQQISVVLVGALPFGAGLVPGGACQLFHKSPASRMHPDTPLAHGLI
jgi:hypothetical protein